MSIRDFKQTLLMASLPCAAETHQQEARGRGGRLDQQRKPPKSRLRDQIASIERQAADLDCTPCGDSLPPLRCPVPLPPAPSTSASLSPHRRQTPGWNEPLKTVVRPPKRTRLSDYAAALVVGQPLPEGPYGQTQQERERSGWDDGLEEEEEGEEEDRAVSAGGDSEAGLFIQSQNEGLQEPLILWPRDGGEGSSQGAGGLVQVPSSINGRLMEHQREGVKFLYRLYSENKGGVLGDDMGLGKTIQVIAFLAAVLQGDHLHPKIKNGDRGHKLSPNKKQVLIICPTSVLRNWEQEFHAWGAFEVAIYHGVHRELVLNRLECRNLQIVLTSFDTFRIHGDCLCAIDWDCMVVDEAHRLKNDKSNLYKVCTKIRTKRRYGLTGTIMQNKIMDLFNVFDWAAPGCLGSREHFREFYDEPLKQGQRISAPEKFIRIAEERRLHLAKVLQKCLLRREKHETIGHLMMGKEDNVIFCEMSPLQCRAYKRLLASPDFQCLTKKDEPCSCGSPLTFAECCYRTVPHGIIWPYLHRENPDGCDSCPYCLVLPCLTKLQQVSNHLELIKPNSKDDMEKQKKDELLAESVLAEDAGLVGGTTQDESFLGLSDTQHCGKMKALELMLAHWVQQGDKVLLFSYSVRMLDILDRFLIRKGYCFSRLDGSTAMSMRQSLVDDFNRSPSKQVFLISTRAGGLGLNLVSANRVVIFDPNWNPAQDLQAQDRSFRFGQRRHVTVYRLLAAGSLEELVYTRQIYKQQLFNIAVSGNLEKRYFEGVQDSKDNKGELFGISNLFRDLSEKAFTSEIIEKHDKRALSFCNSISKVGKIEERVVSEGRSEGSIAGAQDGGELTKSVECGLGFGNKAVLQKCCVKQRSEDKLTVVLRDAGVIYAHRNEDVVNYKSKTKPDGGAGRVALKNNQKSEFGLVRLPLTPNSSIAASKADNLRKEGNQHVKKIFKQVNTLESKTVLSKEEQFASLAKFKGMDKTQFCKWLLSVSEAEKQNLLLDFKQRQKSFQLHSPSKFCGT